jgi:hypothetical protein
MSEAQSTRGVVARSCGLAGRVALGYFAQIFFIVIGAVGLPSLAPGVAASGVVVERETVSPPVAKNVGVINVTVKEEGIVWTLDTDDPPNILAGMNDLNDVLAIGREQFGVK